MKPEVCEARTPGLQHCDNEELAIKLQPEQHSSLWTKAAHALREIRKKEERHAYSAKEPDPLTLAEGL